MLCRLCHPVRFSRMRQRVDFFLDHSPQFLIRARRQLFLQQPFELIEHGAVPRCFALRVVPYMESLSTTPVRLVQRALTVPSAGCAALLPCQFRGACYAYPHPRHIPSVSGIFRTDIQRLSRCRLTRCSNPAHRHSLSH